MVYTHVSKGYEVGGERLPNGFSVIFPIDVVVSTIQGQSSLLRIPGRGK